MSPPVRLVVRFSLSQAEAFIVLDAAKARTTNPPAACAPRASGRRSAPSPPPPPQTPGPGKASSGRNNPREIVIEHVGASTLNARAQIRSNPPLSKKDPPPTPILVACMEWRSGGCASHPGNQGGPVFVRKVDFSEAPERKSCQRDVTGYRLCRHEQAAPPPPRRPRVGYRATESGCRLSCKARLRSDGAGPTGPH